MHVLLFVVVIAVGIGDEPDAVTGADGGFAGFEETTAAGVDVTNEPAAEPATRDDNTVLVLNLRHTGTAADEAQAMTAHIAEQLSQRAELRVMTVSEIDDLVELQLNLGAMGCTDEACIAELSKAANARFVVSGSMGRVGKEIVLNLLLLSMTDLDSSLAVGSATRSARSADLLIEMLPEVFDEMFGEGKAVAAKPRYRLPAGSEVSFAVFDLKPLALSKETAQSLTQMLAVEIKKIEGTQVVSRDDIASMLQLEARKSLLDCEDEMTCLAEIGGALGVEMLVVGHVGKLGESFTVSLRLIRVGESLVVSRITETFRGAEDQLLPAVRHAGRRLLGIEATQPGLLAFAANEQEAEVFVDNEKVGILPMPPLSGLAPGRHSVRVSKEDFFDWRTDIFVEPGNTTAVWALLEEQPAKWYEHWWVWGAVGAVVAGATIGIAVAMQPIETPDAGLVDVTIR